MISRLKNRVEMVRELNSHKNFLSVFAAILIVFLNFLTVSAYAPDAPESSQAEQTVTAETETEETGWRFYPIDLVVLGVGGGFCTIMIIRERRKAKEGLN